MHVGSRTALNSLSPEQNSSQQSLPLQLDMQSTMRAKPGPLGNALAIRGISLDYGLDWGVQVLCALLLIISDRISPREAYILKDHLSLTSYPLLPNTVPSATVPVIAILAPACFLGAYLFLFKRKSIELHHLLLGLLTSVLFTGVMTNMLKCPVGRLRPDFNARCWPDGVIAWKSEDALGGYAKCSGDPGDVAEGRKSFPSGERHAKGLPVAPLWLMLLSMPFSCRVVGPSLLAHSELRVDWICLGVQCPVALTVPSGQWPLIPHTSHLDAPQCMPLALLQLLTLLQLHVVHIQSLDTQVHHSNIHVLLHGAIGHSSWSASGLGYVSWFLLDKLAPFDGDGHPWRLVAAVLPALGALAVGITRYTDYWHHGLDIFAGLALGYAISWWAYRQQKMKLSDGVDNMGSGGAQQSEGRPLLQGSEPISDMPV